MRLKKVSPDGKTRTRYLPNATPQRRSLLISYPDSFLYHWMTSLRSGRPGVAPGSKAGFARDVLLSISSFSPIDHDQGPITLQRSESGWPIVAISQSRIPMTRGSVLWKTKLSILKSPCINVDRSFGCLDLSLKKLIISWKWGISPTGSLDSTSRVSAWAFDSVPNVLHCRS